MRSDQWHIWHFIHVWIDYGIVSLQGQSSNIIDVYKKNSRLNWNYGFQRTYTCYQFILLILKRNKLMQLWTKIYLPKFMLSLDISNKLVHLIKHLSHFKLKTYQKPNKTNYKNHVRMKCIFYWWLSFRFASLCNIQEFQTFSPLPPNPSALHNISIKFKSSSLPQITAKQRKRFNVEDDDGAFLLPQFQAWTGIDKVSATFPLIFFFLLTNRIQTYHFYACIMFMILE